jgi:hypothetical protein
MIKEHYIGVNINPHLSYPTSRLAAKSVKWPEGTREFTPSQTTTLTKKEFNTALLPVAHFTCSAF